LISSIVRSGRCCDKQTELIDKTSADNTLNDVAAVMSLGIRWCAKGANMGNSSPLKK
jgi:hypothetical protein